MSLISNIKSETKLRLTDFKIRHFLESDVSMTGPVTLAGFYSSTIGIGEGVRRLYASLKNSGVDVYPVDMTPIIIPHMQKMSFDEVRDPGVGPIIFHINPPEISPALAYFRSRNLADRYRIACWIWETDTPPKYWQRYQRYFNEFWSPSEFSAATLSHLGEKFHPIGYAFEPQIQPIENPSAQTFNVLVMADLLSSWRRKNPIGALLAFRKAFDDNPSTQLTIKLSNVDRSSSYWRELTQYANGAKNITYITDRLTSEEMSELTSNQNVMLNLHRAEGYGLPIVEGLLKGCEVVFTNWSSPKEFAHLPGAHGVSYGLTPPHDPQGHYKKGLWAEPDISIARQHLQQLYKNWEDRNITQRLSRRREVSRVAHDFFGYPRFTKNHRKILARFDQFSEVNSS